MNLNLHLRVHISHVKHETGYNFHFSKADKTKWACFYYCYSLKTKLSRNSVIFKIYKIHTLTRHQNKNSVPVCWHYNRLEKHVWCRTWKISIKVVKQVRLVEDWLDKSECNITKKWKIRNETKHTPILVLNSSSEF